MQMLGSTVPAEENSYILNGVLHQSGPRYSQHFWNHGRLLAGSYRTPIIIQCNSQSECDQVQSKLKDPTFTSAVAASAGVPASAFKSVSEPQTYDTASFNTAVTTIHTTSTDTIHTTNTTTENDDAWMNATIALVVVCVLLLIAVAVLAVKLSNAGSGGNAEAVKTGDLEKTLEDDVYTV
jgi:hypothetical protein